MPQTSLSWGLLREWRSESGVWTQQGLPHCQEPWARVTSLLTVLKARPALGTQAHCLLKPNFCACVFP